MIDFTTFDANQAWRQQAACRGLDPEIFIPVNEEEENADQAKRVCRQCPVRRECFDAHRDEKIGIWGGTTTKERRAIHRGSRKVEEIWAQPLPREQQVA